MYRVQTYDHYCVLGLLRFLQPLFNESFVELQKKSSLVIQWSEGVFR